MTDKSTRLSEVCAKLAARVVEQRDRWKVFKSNRCDAWIKARIFMIAI